LCLAASSSDILEQDAALSTCGPYPIELDPPIIHPLDQTTERVVTDRIPNMDFDFIPFVNEAKVKGREIGGVTDP
jgi:hypothetical protein